MPEPVQNQAAAQENAGEANFRAMMEDTGSTEVLEKEVTPQVPQGVEPTKPEAKAPEVKPGGEPPAEYQFQYKPLWDQLTKDGIEIPKEFAQGKFGENISEWDALRNVIIENTEMPGEGDPFVQQYLNIPADQRPEFIKQYNERQAFYTLPASEGISSWYSSLVDDKGQPKYTEEQITQYVDKLDPITQDQEWQKIQQMARGAEQQMWNTQSEKYKAVEAQRMEQTNVRRRQTAQQVAMEIDTMKDYASIPLADDVKAEIKKNFEFLTQINPKTGNPHIINLLNDDKKLLDIVAALTIKEGDYVRKYLSAEKENFKDEILDKLDPNPKSKGGAQMFKVSQRPEDFV